MRPAAAIALLLLLTACHRPVVEAFDPLQCTAGWQVEAETALRSSEPLTFPPIVPLDHGVYAGFDGGWQRVDWTGAARGQLFQLPPGDGELAAFGDRLLVTRRGAAGVAVHALEPDGGFTRYATIPVTNALGASPFDTTAGVLVFSELPDAGVRLDRTTESTSVSVRYPAGRRPLALAAAGSGLLLLTGSPGALAVTPLTAAGETNGATVEHKPAVTGAALQPCGSGTAALITSEYTDDGGSSVEVTWLDDDGNRVMGPVALGSGFFPNLLCAGDSALAAWTKDGRNTTELTFARVNSAGVVTPEPLALSAEPGSGNWYAVLKRNDDRLGLAWLRYSDDAGYRSMLASLRCKSAQ